MVYVSVTPEIGLDELYTYAGGLGVLEADKFYAASRRGLDYLVLTLLYRGGYVDYDFRDGRPAPRPQAHPVPIHEVLRPEEEFTVDLRGETVYVRPWVYERGSGRVVFFEATCPMWARRLTDRVYIEEVEDETFYKYILLAKASAKYLEERVGLDRVEWIDLQEAYTALLTLALPGFERFRFTTHTPGPWGHPVFPSKLLSREFNADLPGDSVMLTRLGLERARAAFTVSAKHLEIARRMFPEYQGKLSHVTNGVDIERWMHPAVRRILAEKGLDGLDAESLRRARLEARRRLEGLLKRYKPSLRLREGVPVVVWARRLTRYKRPYFASMFIEEHRDLDAVFVLAGKPHPRDSDGLVYASKFASLAREHANVVYIPDYDVHKAKLLLSGGDLLLFTPFSGWEACGTSYMKAAVNGVPTLASRDGGVLELIEDGVNGWLFGSDIRELIDIYSDPKAREVDEREYREFSRKLLEVLESYDTAKYWDVSLNALKSSLGFVDIDRVLDKLYGQESAAGFSRT